MTSIPDSIKFKEALAIYDAASEKVRGANAPVEARLYDDMGYCYFQLEQYAKALELQQAAYSVEKIVLGTRHRNTLLSLHWMISLNLYYLDNDQEGARLCEIMYIGKDHVPELDLMHNLKLHLWRWTIFLRLDDFEGETQMKKRVQRTLQNYLKSSCDKEDSVIGCSFFFCGDFDAALEAFQRLFETQKKSLGPDHSKVISTQSNLADTYYELGRYEEAEALHKDILTKRKVTRRLSHKYALRSEFNLGHVCYKRGNLCRALEYYQTAFRGFLNLHGPNHSSTWCSQSCIADTFVGLGRYDEAEALRENIFSSQKMVLGPNHSKTLKSEWALADAYHDSSNYNAALVPYKHVWEVFTISKGADDIETFNVQGDIAETYYRLGQYEEAEKLWKDLLARQRMVLGPIHPETRKSSDMLSNVYYKKGDFLSALEYNRRVYEESHQSCEVSDSDKLRSQSNLAISLINFGRHDEAEGLLQDLLARRKHDLWSNDLDFWWIAYKLGRFYHDKGNYAFALEKFQLSSFAQPTETNDTQALLAQMWIADCLIRIDRHEEARTKLAELLPAQISALGPDHPETLWTEFAIGRTFHAQGEYVLAREHCQLVFERRKNSLGADEPQTLEAQSFVADCHVWTGLYNEAGKMLEDLLERRRIILGPDHLDTQETRSYLNHLKFDVYLDDSWSEVGSVDDQSDTQSACSEPPHQYSPPNDLQNDPQGMKFIPGSTARRKSI